MLPTAPRTFEVHARSTAVFGRVLCNARTHHFIVDGPVQNGCPGEELTPPELFLTSIGSCGVELLQVIAKERDETIGDVHVRVDGTVDRGRQPREDVTVFTSVHLHFVVHGADDARAAALVEAFRRR